MNFKQLNFMCGLPRSGSTLLATLLNQHPSIYASPHSALLDGVYAYRQAGMTSQSIQYGLQIPQYQETLWTIPHIFYSSIEKEFIFDKQFVWSTPENYHIALKIAHNPRFLVCYRPILEVLTSFISKAQANKDFYLNKEFDAAPFYPKHYLSRNDAMAEYMMTAHPLLPTTILALANAKKEESSGRFYFVSYDNLVTDPKKELSEIFTFLGLEQIEAETDNVKDIFEYKDHIAFGVSGFHRVRPKIEKKSPSPEKYFSPYILSKYENELDAIGITSNG